jgi:hypothetical protein
MRIRFPAVLFGGLALIAAAAASPQISKAEYWTYGSGSESCGEWIATHIERTPVGLATHLAWVQGYLTAFNGWALRPKTDGDQRVRDISDRTYRTGLEAVFWINDYCLDRPSEPVAGAAQALIKHLISEHRGF